MTMIRLGNVDSTAHLLRPVNWLFAILTYNIKTTQTNTCELENSLTYITDEKDSRAQTDTKIKSLVLAIAINLSSILRLT